MKRSQLQAAQRRADSAADYLRRRRIHRIAFFIGGGLLLATIIADHAGAFGHHFDDVARFNHRRFLVTDVASGDTLRVRSPDGKTETLVGLLGIVAPHAGEYWAGPSRDYVAERLMGKPITLLLEPPRKRDETGRLMAYVFPSDSDNLNVDLVHDGMARADRREPCLLRSLIEPAEADARKKHRGLWKDAMSSPMPSWR
jgi:endonuclease YncB( thermonuclease family)